MPRSKPGPALRRSAGARLATMRVSREPEVRVLNRRTHALARLAHRRVGEPDNRESRQATGRHVHLDTDVEGLDAEEGEGLNACNRHRRRR